MIKILFFSRIVLLLIRMLSLTTTMCFYSWKLNFLLFLDLSLTNYLFMGEIPFVKLFSRSSFILMCFYRNLLPILLKILRVLKYTFFLRNHRIYCYFLLTGHGCICIKDIGVFLLFWQKPWIQMICIFRATRRASFDLRKMTFLRNQTNFFLALWLKPFWSCIVLLFLLKH